LLVGREVRIGPGFLKGILGGESFVRADAYLLASDAVDFSITQLVDGKRGVHEMIPKSIFKGK
jgi:acetamidase/formamidase